MKLKKILKKFKKKRRKSNKKLDNLKEKKKEENKIKRKLKGYIKKIKEFFKKHKEKIGKFYGFFLFVGAYGFLVNFMLWGIWKIKFTILSFLAYGILAYFIREESVLLIRRIFARR